jgi:hypothetical protein
MNNQPEPICYLCSGPIDNSEDISEDHVIPHQFIKRNQPKAKGFEYGGKLPTHKTCNHHFGSEVAKAEVICQKALAMLRVLHDPKCVSVTRHKSDPSIPILVIHPDCLNDFTQPEKAFFGLIETSDRAPEAWQSPSFFTDKQKVNVFARARSVVLTVLAKSAAAILIKRRHITLSSAWRILAVPYFVGDTDIDLNEIFGLTKPFEIGVQAWIDQHSNGDWMVVYKAQGLLVIFHFALTRDDTTFQISKLLFPKDKQYVFEADKLIDLIGYDWEKNPYS